MLIQEQIIEWFSCAETLKEKLEVLRALSEIQENLICELQELDYAEIKDLF